MSNFWRLFLKLDYFAHMNTFQKAQKWWCDLWSLTWTSGNNAIAYEQRKERKTPHTAPILALPTHKHIQNLDDISLWNEIVIQDIDHHDRLISEVWLAHIYTYGWGAPTIIFDNHNYALYRRLTYFSPTSAPPHIIHIDQHSDMNTPDSRLDPDIYHTWWYTHADIQHYTIHDCQISNFIHPYMRLFPETQLTWIKSEHQLLQYNDLISQISLTWPCILDIDIDFRAPQMSIQQVDETIRITRSLISHASLVTIATSPMFIDQERAIEIVKELLK